MRRTDFHFELPKELIAVRPVEPRSASRMLALDGASGRHTDLLFRHFPALLSAGDLVVFNDTRVVPARVHGIKDSGGRIEILLERALAADTALVQVRASHGLKPKARVSLPGGHSATMLARQEDLYVLQFSCAVLAFFEAHGAMPLPGYLGREAEAADRERYQTVYARAPGAVAAPTAGLHFDLATLTELEARRVQCAYVTLHVGAGTFQPVRVEDPAQHVMHEEYLEVPPATAAAINATRGRGGRIIAVGTTVVRCLETALDGESRSVAFVGSTRLFIRPGYRFRMVDAMVTNFHLPESTLLMLCAAFVGREQLLAAYAHAVAARYRFFSYGDAMLLTSPAAWAGS